MFLKLWEIFVFLKNNFFESCEHFVEFWENLNIFYKNSEHFLKIMNIFQMLFKKIITFFMEIFNNFQKTQSFSELFIFNMNIF